jgi:suppressor for copper-sensitivity B
MATPYLLLAAWPRAARLLPRPGAWMVRLREIMGFLLAATAIWLFYVLARQVSAASLAAVQLALLALALGVWLRRSPAPGWLRRGATAGAALAAAATVAVAATAPAPREVGAAPAGLLAWVEWDPLEAERLVASGTPVFVDVTADWCFTCKVNEQLVLDTPPVAAAFREHGVVAMRADWTNRDRRIGELLAAHGRYGIPFYLLHRPGARPHVFPELLTQGAVVEAVEATARRAAR